MNNYYNNPQFNPNFQYPQQPQPNYMKMPNCYGPNTFNSNLGSIEQQMAEFKKNVEDYERRQKNGTIVDGIKVNEDNLYKFVMNENGLHYKPIKYISKEKSERLEELKKVYNENIKNYCPKVKINKYKNEINNINLNQMQEFSRIYNILELDDDDFFILLNDIDLLMDVFLNHVPIYNDTISIYTEIKEILFKNNIQITNHDILNKDYFNNHLLLAKDLVSKKHYLYTENFNNLNDNVSNKNNYIMSNEMKMEKDKYNITKYNDFIYINGKFVILPFEKIKNDFYKLKWGLRNIVKDSRFDLSEGISIFYLAKILKDKFNMNPIIIEKYECIIIEGLEYEGNLLKNTLLLI